MFQWLKNMIGSKKHPENIDLIVSFIVANNRVEIDVNWAKIDEKHSELLGTLLYYINNGVFIENIVKQLYEHGKTNEEINKFVKDVVGVWSGLQKQTEEMIKKDEEEPIVEPDSFMSTGKEEE